MSLPSTLPAAVVATVLTRLAAFFLAGADGDMATARHTAAQMLAAYRPETANELCLAASIIGFNFQSLEALAQAAAPDLPVTRILRLRGSAVSLNREAAKAELRLTQLRQTPHQAASAQPGLAQQAEPQPKIAEPAPKIEKAIALIRDTEDLTLAAKANGQTWTQAHEQRQRDQRLASSLARAQARVAAHANGAIRHALPNDQTIAQAI